MSNFTNAGIGNSLSAVIKRNTSIAEDLGLKGVSNNSGNNINTDQIVEAILSKLNLSDPHSYIQSAYDIANLNTQTSQALAREQMAFQTEANAKAMDFSASEAQKVRDWQTMMSDTAHQREVKDLIAAGLNPILSANQGAAVGSAPAAQGVTSAGAKGSVDTSAVNAVVNAYSQLKQLEIAEKNIDAQMAMNKLNNETNRYMAETSASAGMYSAGLNSSAMRYSSELNSAASRFATMMNEELVKGGYYNQFASFFDWLTALAGDDPKTSAREIDTSKPEKRYPYQQPGADQLLQNIVNAFKGKGESKRMLE